MAKDKFECQREWFEQWYKKQFPKAAGLLSKDGEFAYFDAYTNCMFIGFCAGFEIAGKFKS